MAFNRDYSFGPEEREIIDLLGKDDAINLMEAFAGLDYITVPSSHHGSLLEERVGSRIAEIICDNMGGDRIFVYKLRKKYEMQERSRKIREAVGSGKYTANEIARMFDFTPRYARAKAVEYGVQLPRPTRGPSRRVSSAKFIPHHWENLEKLDSNRKIRDYYRARKDHGKQFHYSIAAEDLGRRVSDIRSVVASLLYLRRNGEADE